MLAGRWQLRYWFKMRDFGGTSSTRTVTDTSNKYPCFVPGVLKSSSLFYGLKQWTRISMERCYLDSNTPKLCSWSASSDPDPCAMNQKLVKEKSCVVSPVSQEAGLGNDMHNVHVVGVRFPLLLDSWKYRHSDKHQHLPGISKIQKMFLKATCSLWLARALGAHKVLFNLSALVSTITTTSLLIFRNSLKPASWETFRCSDQNTPSGNTWWYKNYQTPTCDSPLNSCVCY